MKGPKYKEDYVDMESLKIKQEANNRYSLEINMKGSGTENLSIIMMNPSQANKEYSDKSVNKVIKYVFENMEKVKKVYILNIYSVYEKYSKKFKCFYAKNVSDELLIGGKNDQEIKRCVNKSDRVIIGWGLASGLNKAEESRYKERCRDVFNLVNGINTEIYCIGSLTKTGYVRHLGRNRNLNIDSLNRVTMVNNEFTILG